MHNKTFDLLFYLIHHSDLNVWLRSAKLQVGVPDITYVFDISSRGHNYTSAVSKLLCFDNDRPRGRFRGRNGQHVKMVIFWAPFGLA